MTVRRPLEVDRPTCSDRVAAYPMKAALGHSRMSIVAPLAYEFGDMQYDHRASARRRIVALTRGEES